MTWSKQSAADNASHILATGKHTGSQSGCQSVRCLQLLPEDVPGKSGGPPGNAFELVYISVTDAVRRAVRRVDPVLADWIRYPTSVSLTVTRPMPKCLVGAA